MGFSPPVPQQDSNWEIRVAVLVSLVLQIFLVFVAPLRKRSSSPLPRFAVWSCYLLADWVADLALGLLLNNMGNIGSGGSNGSPPSSSLGHGLHNGIGLKRGPVGNNSSDTNSNNSPIIFAFWAPFLLLHLGGPDTITAYSLEDNELWLRHLIGVLFELFAAAVVFFCSLQGNPLIAATIAMFVVGIIKYGERTCSLYSGSVDGFRDSILGEPDPGPNYAKLMGEFDAKEKAGLRVEIAIADVVDEEQHANATTISQETPRDNPSRHSLEANKSVQAYAYKFFKIFRCLFVNLILSFEERKMSQDFFTDTDYPFKVIEVELNYIYDMVYTKAAVIHSRTGYILRLIGSCCITAALIIFILHDKENFQRVDVGITYMLLIGAMALDMVALTMLLFSNWTLVFLENSPRFAWLADAARRIECWRPRHWSETVSQLNLISYCLVEPEGGRRARCLSPAILRSLARVADKLCMKALFDEFIFIRREPVKCENKDQDLLKFIFERLKVKALNAGNYEQIKEQCELRGEGALNEHKIDEQKNGENIIRGSVRGDFDESLLLWHIATDLCFVRDQVGSSSAANGQRPSPGPSCSSEQDYRTISKRLSEYMLYLLIKQPAMLSATAGIGLLRYRDTCAEARRFFESGGWDPGHDDARKMLLKVNTTKKPADVKGDQSKSVLFDACILAKELLKIGDEPQVMWKVVAEVWGEMLAYAASKCRGSTHIRQLSRGGELITMVWFLMAHLGLGEMYRIQAGDAKAKLVIRDQ